jgi:hypothetical protein
MKWRNPEPAPDVETVSWFAWLPVEGATHTYWLQRVCAERVYRLDYGGGGYVYRNIRPVIRALAAPWDGT